ncbi:MAG: PAS domain S-box protein [Planctomycetota bacterium]
MRSTELEEKYRHLFENMAQGVVYQDSGGKIISANPAAERILGLSLEQMQGRESIDPRWRSIHEDGSDFPGEEHPAMVTLKTGDPVTDVTMGVYNPSEDTHRWININSNPVTKPNEDKPYQVFTTFDDMTERKLVEDNLKKERDFSGSIIGTAQTIILVLDKQDRIVSFNPYMEKITGYRIEEVKGKDWFENFLPDRDWKQIRQVFRNAVDNIDTSGTVNPVLTKDGRERLIEWHNKTLNDAGGETVGVLATGQDITERMRLEDELRIKAHLLDSATDSIFIHDLKGKFLYVNKAAYEARGYTEDELLRLNLHELDAPEFEKLIEPRIKDLLETGRATFESAHICKDGSRLPVEVNVQIQEHGSQKLIFSIVRDITERKTAEERQKLASEILEILNESGGQVNSIRKILELIKEFTGFDAVGIRLQDGDDFPYYETNGFPPEFIEAEKYLCTYDESGNMLRDPEGRPLLECMCGNVIRGRIDPSLPFFTDGGSFWTNCTTELLASTTEEDRQARTRNRCNGEGYESVALVPLRAASEIIGLLQLNDSRKNMFTPENITFFEGIGASVGIALSRIRAEQAIQVAARDWQKTFDSIADSICIVGLDKKIIQRNRGTRNMFGKKADSAVGGSCCKLVHGSDQPLESCPWNKMNNSLRRESEELKFNDKFFRVTVDPIFDDENNLIGGIHIVSDVTVRNRAEGALKESEAKWRSLVANAPNYVVIVNREGVIEFINRATTQLTPDKLIGTSIYEHLEPEYHDAARHAIEQAFQSGTIGSYEANVRRLDGSKMWVETHVGPIKQDDEIIAATLIASDITNRKQAEEVLRASEIFQRTLLESSPDYIFVLDADGVIRKVNRLHPGHREEDVIGRKAIAFVPPEYHNVFEEALRQALETGQLQSCETMVDLPGGRHFLLNRIKPVSFADMESVVLLIATDITERKRIDEKLQDKISEMDSFINNIPDMAWLKDLDSNFVLANKAFGDAVGMDPAFLASHSCAVCFGAEAAEKFKEDDTRVITGKKQIVVEESIVDVKGNRIWLETIKSPILDASGNVTGTVGIAHNITERKHAESALRLSEERYRGLFESSRDAIMTLAPPSWRFTSGNPATVEMFNTEDEDEFISLGPWELSPETQPDGRPSSEKAREMIETAMREGSHYFEWTHKRLHGEDFPATVLLTRVEIGGQVFLQATVRDITERKLAEEKMNVYVAGIENAYDGIVFCEMNGNIVYWNNASCDIFGYSPSEMKTMNISRFNANEAEGKTLENSIRENGKFYGEITGMKKSGKLFTALLSVSIVKDDKGEPIGRMGVFQDITVQKLSEEVQRVVYEVSMGMASAENMTKAMNKFLQILLTIKDIDAGGLYFVDRTSGNIDLICHSGLSEKFVKRAAHFPAGSSHAELIMEGKPLYTSYKNVLPEARDDIREQEGIRGIAIIPILHEARAVACVNLASHVHEKIPESVHFILESIAGAIGSTVARVRAEEEMRESEQRFRELAGLLPQTIFEIDTTGKLTYLNRHGLISTGYSQEELDEGINAMQVICEEDRERITNSLKRNFDGEKVTGNEYSILRKDGGTFPSIIHSAPILRGDDIVGLRGICVDLTERKRAEQALLESEEKYRTLVENSSQGIVIADLKKQRIAYANPAMPKIMGLTRDELMGGSLRDLMNILDPKDKAYVHESLENRLKGLPPLPRKDLKKHNRDGSTTWIEYHSDKINYMGKPALQVAITDITERKRLEAEIIEISAREQRRIGQDLHDGLSQNLASISYLAGVLEKRLSSESHAEAGLIKEVCEIITQSVAQSRNLARTLQPVDPDSGGLVSSLRYLGQSTEKLFGISCKIDVDDIEFQDFTIASNIYLIAHEAVYNAVKHAKAACIEIRMKLNKDNLTINIADNGVGLPDNLKERKGMGLNIIKYRADLIGGILEVKNNPEGGTTVSCSFSDVSSIIGGRNETGQEKEIEG